jgi:hypothetical protein
LPAHPRDRDKTPPCPPPEVDSVDPDTGVQGQTVAVTFTGENLSGCSVFSPSENITITVINVTDTEIDTTFQIAADAVVQDYEITIVNDCGRDTGTFTAAPQIQVTGVDPDNGCVGTGGQLSISGSGFTGSTVSASTDLGLGTIVVSSATLITANYQILDRAPGGTVEITVSNSGSSDTGEFTINPMTVTGIDPENGCSGSSVDVTITGTCFTNVSVAADDGSGITVSGATTVDSQTVTATLAIDSSATVGAYNITVSSTFGFLPYTQQARHLERRNCNFG